MGCCAYPYFATDYLDMSALTLSLYWWKAALSLSLFLDERLPVTAFSLHSLIIVGMWQFCFFHFLHWHFACSSFITPFCAWTNCLWQICFFGFVPVTTVISSTTFRIDVLFLTALFVHVSQWTFVRESFISSFFAMNFYQWKLYFSFFLYELLSVKAFSLPVSERINCFVSLSVTRMLWLDALCTNALTVRVLLLHISLLTIRIGQLCGNFVCGGFFSFSVSAWTLRQ